MISPKHIWEFAIQLGIHGLNIIFLAQLLKIVDAVVVTFCNSPYNRKEKHKIELLTGFLQNSCLNSFSFSEHLQLQLSWFGSFIIKEKAQKLFCFDILIYFITPKYVSTPENIIYAFFIFGMINVTTSRVSATQNPVGSLPKLLECNFFPLIYQDASVCSDILQGLIWFCTENNIYEMRSE